MIRIIVQVLEKSDKGQFLELWKLAHFMASSVVHLLISSGASAVAILDFPDVVVLKSGVSPHYHDVAQERPRKRSGARCILV